MDQVFGSAEFSVYHSLAFNRILGTLVDEEEREKGTVKLSVYKAYWKAYGDCLASWIFIFLALSQGKKLCFVFQSNSFYVYLSDTFFEIYKVHF